MELDSCFQRQTEEEKETESSDYDPLRGPT